MLIYDKLDREIEILDGNVKFVSDVFATWENGEIIYLLGGDDGHWWIMGSYHKDWMDRIVHNLASYVSKKS